VPLLSQELTYKQLRNTIASFCDHHLPSVLKASNVDRANIERNLCLSARLERLLAQDPEYFRICTSSLLKQAAAITRILSLDSRAYVTVTLPRLERVGKTFVVRHGVHLHFYDAIVNRFQATQLRHDCIDQLGESDDMSLLLRAEKGHSLAAYLSALLDPCALTEPTRGTGVRFLHQFKAIWTPARQMNARVLSESGFHPSTAKRAKPIGSLLFSTIALVAFSSGMVKSLQPKLSSFPILLPC
jgi:hypothetical protein